MPGAPIAELLESLTRYGRSLVSFAASAGWATDFSKRTVALDEIRSGGVPRDGIPPIDELEFASVAEAPPYMHAREPVISLEVDGTARAHPLAIMMWHEIVNDTIGGVPVAVTFCPLCNTAVVFDRRVDGDILRFGVSGLLCNSDLIMWDDATQSWWQKATGDAIVGSMAGTELSLPPAPIIAWEAFAENFADGEVLIRPIPESAVLSRYDNPPYAGYDDVDNSPFLYDGPVDGRLPATARVLTVEVEVDGQFVAYPFSFLAEVGLVNDRIGALDIVALFDDGMHSAFLDERRRLHSSGAATVYERIVDGRTLTLEHTDARFFDLEPGLEWNLLGRAVSGALKGERLESVIHRNDFWFAWAAFNPETQVRASTDQLGSAVAD